MRAAGPSMTLDRHRGDLVDDIGSRRAAAPVVARSTSSSRSDVGGVADQDRPGVADSTGYVASGRGCRSPRMPGIPCASGSRRWCRSSASCSGRSHVSRTISAGDPRLARFVVVGGDTVVADQRIGHADDLPAERGIRADLLVSGHRGREDDLAGGVRLGAESATTKYATVGEGERGVMRGSEPLHCSNQLQRSCTTLPSTIVMTARPVISIPRSGVFLDFVFNASSVTVHR